MAVPRTHGTRTHGNRLLAAVNRADYARLKPHFKTVLFTQHQVLIKPGRRSDYVYFPDEGFGSLLTVIENEAAVETTAIGTEGAIGLPLLFHGEIGSVRAVVHMPGRATAVDAAALHRAIEESATLRALFSAYVRVFVIQVMQTVACNALHSTEQRMAKWLLTSADRANGSGIPLTHEVFAAMLGVGRPTVSLIARKLQIAGVISYARGRIAIENRRKLERLACPCYRVIHRAYEQLLPLTYK
jgi:CRP-like cAMP-binding protein